VSSHSALFSPWRAKRQAPKGARQNNRLETEAALRANAAPGGVGARGFYYLRLWKAKKNNTKTRDLAPFRAVFAVLGSKLTKPKSIV
jgi:hypothetical protein